MTDATQALGDIQAQVLTTLPIASQNILVDDSVALVDDTTALTGSQTTPVHSARTSTDSFTPTIRLPYRR